MSKGWAQTPIYDKALHDWRHSHGGTDPGTGTYKAPTRAPRKTTQRRKR